MYNQLEPRVPFCPPSTKLTMGAFNHWSDLCPSERHTTSHTEATEADGENFGTTQEVRLANNVQFLLPLLSISEFKNL